MSNHTLVTAAVFVVVLFLWDLRGGRRGTDAAEEEAPGDFAVRLAKYMVVAGAALVVALVLDALGVPGGAVLAATAIVALLLGFYIAPAVGFAVLPWLRKRRARSRS